MCISYTVGSDVLLAVVLKSVKTRPRQHLTITNVTAKKPKDQSSEIACLKTIPKAHSKKVFESLVHDVTWFISM